MTRVLIYLIMRSYNVFSSCADGEVRTLISLLRRFRLDHDGNVASKN